MRIEGTKSGFGETPSRDRVGDKKRSSPAGGTAGARPPDFLAELQAAVEEEAPEEADFKQLIAEVDETGRELLAHQDAGHLAKYKQAVKKFLLAAVRQSFRVQVIEGRGPHPKLYVFVERIEMKLDELARAVLSAHKEPLKLLSQVEELRGLLLDLKS